MDPEIEGPYRRGIPVSSWAHSAGTEHSPAAVPTQKARAHRPAGKSRPGPARGPPHCALCSVPAHAEQWLQLQDGGCPQLVRAASSIPPSASSLTTPGGCILTHQDIVVFQLINLGGFRVLVCKTPQGGDLCLHESAPLWPGERAFLSRPRQRTVSQAARETAEMNPEDVSQSKAEQCGAGHRGANRP